MSTLQIYTVVALARALEINDVTFTVPHLVDFTNAM